MDCMIKSMKFICFVFAITSHDNVAAVVVDDVVHKRNFHFILRNGHFHPSIRIYHIVRNSIF